MSSRKDSRRNVESMLKQKKEAEIEHMDKSIQRNVQKSIIKNKGLTRKRKRVDSNGRVKKRMKYEKMQKQRNSQVKQYKEGKQGVYKGEASGIKTGVDRGVKM